MELKNSHHSAKPSAGKYYSGGGKQAKRANTGQIQLADHELCLKYHPDEQTLL